MHRYFIRKASDSSGYTCIANMYAGLQHMYTYECITTVVRTSTTGTSQC